MRLRSWIAASAMIALAASAFGAEKEETQPSPTWQPMLARSFDVDANDLRVTGLVVNRNVGCVFLSIEGKSAYCSSHGANRFSPNKKTWAQISELRSECLRHKFLLTSSGIKESRDGGETWSQPIPAPKGFVITEQTWLQYDARHDSLYLAKPGSDLYKLARGNQKSQLVADQ